LQLQEVLKHLEASRLLILEKDCYELAHDILAKIIDSKRQGRDLLIKNLKNTLKFNRENKIEIDRVVLKQYDDLEEDADFDEKRSYM
jgi:S-adenosylmethionine:tRNA-ribosyltransferase-isomerase (queuine synthetase)